MDRFCQTNERENGIVSESYRRWPWLSFGLSPSAAFQLFKSFDQTNESLDIWTAPMTIQWTRQNISSFYVFGSVEYFSPWVLGLANIILGSCEVNLLLVMLEVRYTRFALSLVIANIVMCVLCSCVWDLNLNLEI